MPFRRFVLRANSDIPRRDSVPSGASVHTGRLLSSAHAAHQAQRGADGREDRDKGLDDHLPNRFLVHDN